MKRLFISQPMRDRTDEEILQERQELKEISESLLREEVEVIDSFFQGAPHDAKPLWYISESIKCLSTADVVIFAKDWLHYRGCQIEHICAVSYGFSTIEFDKSDSCWVYKCVI